MSGHEALNEMVQGQLESLETKMDELAAGDTGAADRMVQVEEGLETVRGKLDAMEEGGGAGGGGTGSEELTVALNGLKDEIQGLKRSMEDSVEEISTVNQLTASRLTRLENRMDGIESSLEAARGAKKGEDGSGDGGSRPPAAIPVGGGAGESAPKEDGAGDGGNNDGGEDGGGEGTGEN
jgi:chromosome segregation ATPase